MNSTTIAAPARERLAIRIAESNPHHHLWNNHGTWWCHFTLHGPDYTKRRIRRSLRTRSLPRAIVARDALLSQLAV